MDEFDGAWGSVSLPSTDLRLVVSHDSRCVIGDERQRYISLPLDTLKLIINIVPIINDLLRINISKLYGDTKIELDNLYCINVKSFSWSVQLCCHDIERNEELDLNVFEWRAFTLAINKLTIPGETLPKATVLNFLA